MLGILVFGGISVSAASYDYFYGGVTGLPGYGTTWGKFYPRRYRRVYVAAKGKYTLYSYANRGGKARVSVQEH